MKKQIIMAAFSAVLLGGASVSLPKPASAMPDCPTEVRIRCMGHDVQGRGRLDIYYDSFEECVANETAFMCPSKPIGSLYSSMQPGIVEKQKV